MHRGAALRSHGEVQRVAGTKPKRVLIDELRGRPKLSVHHRQHGEAFGHQPVEHRQRCRALLKVDLPGPELDRHSRGHFGNRPVADHKLRRILLSELRLGTRGHRFVGERRDDQRRVEIEHQ